MNKTQISFGFSYLFLFLFFYPILIFGQENITDTENKALQVMNVPNNLFDNFKFINYKPGKEVPREFFLDRTGQKFDLNWFAGKIVYATFWSQTCKPCMAEKPKLEALKKEFKDHEDIIFIDISFDRYNKVWTNYLDDKKPQGHQWISQNSKQTRKNFQYGGIPFHFIINKDRQYKMKRSIDDAKRLLENEVYLEEWMQTGQSILSSDTSFNVNYGIENMTDQSIEILYTMYDQQSSMTIPKGKTSIVTNISGITQSTECQLDDTVSLPMDELTIYNSKGKRYTRKALDINNWIKINPSVRRSPGGIVLKVSECDFE